MTKQILVNGTEHPVKYGFNALRLFSNETGIGLDELSQLENKMSIDHAIALIWAGMKDGARVQKIDFTMTLDDVADLLDDDPTIINQCVAFFVESFVKPNVDGKK
jgi:hypothetical protein